MPLLPAAIGIVLNADQTQVLLIKRRDIPIWVLPGGGIETGEHPEEALIREIQEETGFFVQVVRKCAEYSPVNRLAAFTSVFICHIQSGNMILSDETADIAFYPIQKLPSPFFFAHAYWMQEAFSHQTLIQRPLTEISYVALLQFFICHPWHFFRLGWTRLTKS